jgi:hypothetical protein
MSTSARRAAAGVLTATSLVALSAGIASAAQAAPTAVQTTRPAAVVSATSSSSRLVVRFRNVTTAVPKPPGAKFGGVAVTVTGGRRGVAAAITSAMGRHLTALRSAFVVRAAGEAQGGGAPGSSVFDGVTGSTASSVHYLSIRLDESINLGGAHPGNLTHAYVFDVASGREVSLVTLFRSTTATNRTIRAALVSANRRVGLTASNVAALSIVPDRTGSTAPLSCYPTGPGLHCVVPPGGVLGYAAGPLEATIAWKLLPLAK